jgi:tryptophanyl-tRNA synthetase
MDSDGKMSTSSGDNATIFTTDDPKTVKNKINKYAFSGGQITVDEHRRIGGNPDVDVSYQWLMFFEEDDAKLEKIYNDYKKGFLLSGELKSILIDKINHFLSEHQSKREKARPENYIYKSEYYLKK